MKLPQFTLLDLLVANLLAGALMCAYLVLMAFAHEKDLRMRLDVFALLLACTCTGATWPDKPQRFWWVGSAAGLAICFALLSAGYYFLNLKYPP